MLKKVLMTMMILGLMLTISNPESARAAIVLKDNPAAVVMPYLDKSTKSAALRLEDATIVSEMVIEQLLNSEKFLIPEREYMQAIFNEHKIATSGLGDPSTQLMVGRLVGAKYMIVGSVTGLSAKESGATGEASIGKAGISKGGKLDFNKYTVIANITLRVIDLETGLIIVAASGEGKSARTHLEFELSQSVTNYYGENGISSNGTTPPASTQTPVQDSSGNGTQNSTQTPVQGSSGNDQVDVDINSNPIGDKSVWVVEPIKFLPIGFYFNEGEGGDGEEYEEEYDEGNQPNTNGQNNQTDQSGQNNQTDQNGQNNQGNQNGQNNQTDQNGQNNQTDQNGQNNQTDQSGQNNQNNQNSGRTIYVKFGMGSIGFGEEQVHNALNKAVIDAIYNKDHGLIAKLNGTAKKRKV